jgi:hypothetical protein
MNQSENVVGVHISGFEFESRILRQPIFGGWTRYARCTSHRSMPKFQYSAGDDVQFVQLRLSECRPGRTTRPFPRNCELRHDCHTTCDAVPKGGYLRVLPLI